MTIEQAHEKLHFGHKLDYLAFNELHIGLEEIYDDFKNRTCDNCRFDNYENSRCDLKRHIPEPYIENFGCNRWEQK